MKRAFHPSDNYKLEEPLLLDPCKSSDPRLLLYKEDGEVIPRYKNSSFPKLFKRADASIYLYHLNHSNFVRARQELRYEIADQIEEAREAFQFLETGDSTHTSRYENAIKILLSKISDEAPFSAFCREMIEPYRCDDFLEGIF